jgi:cobalt-zinc-cadmium efflux system protein
LSHGHDAPHGAHAHAHDHGHLAAGRLVAVLVLVLAYMGVEVAGGLWTGSLALLSDAGHMASDAAALGLSLFAAWVTRHPPTPRRSFGFYRAEILAALVNAAALFAVAAFVVWEAVERMAAPPAVLGGPLLAIAAGGLAVNGASLLLLHGVRGHDLNVRGAFLHVVGDALGSVGALASGACILLWDWRWADPLASLVIAALIVVSAWRLLQEALAVLMEGTPAHLDVDALRQAMLAVPGVCALHDLHVWTIGSGLHSLSCHVVVPPPLSGDAVLPALRTSIAAFGITHVTIQVEAGDGRDCGPCGGC